MTNPKLLAAIERARDLRQAAKIADEVLPKVTAADLDTPEEAAAREGELVQTEMHNRKLSPAHEKIVNCLIAGFQDYQIAQSLGVTQSAVAQQIEEYQLGTVAAARQLEKSSIFTEIDDKYNSTELKLVRQLEKIAPYMTDPVKIAVALRTVNAAKRRSGSGSGQGSDKAKVVVLQLPPVIKNTFIFNNNNEAIAVDGRPLVSMATNQLLKRVQEQKNEQVQDAEFQQISQEHGSVLRHI